MKPRLLLIDNYDSFTYNLVQAFLVLGAEVSVYRNDALTPQEASALSPSHSRWVTGMLSRSGCAMWLTSSATFRKQGAHAQCLNKHWR